MRRRVIGNMMGQPSGGGGGEGPWGNVPSLLHLWDFRGWPDGTTAIPDAASDALTLTTPALVNTMDGAAFSAEVTLDGTLLPNPPSDLTTTSWMLVGSIGGTSLLSWKRWMEGPNGFFRTSAPDRVISVNYGLSAALYINYASAFYRKFAVGYIEGLGSIAMTGTYGGNTPTFGFDPAISSDTTGIYSHSIDICNGNTGYPTIALAIFDPSTVVESDITTMWTYLTTSI